MTTQPGSTRPAADGSASSRLREIIDSELAGSTPLDKRRALESLVAKAARDAQLSSEVTSRRQRLAAIESRYKDEAIAELQRTRVAQKYSVRLSESSAFLGMACSLGGIAYLLSKDISGPGIAAVVVFAVLQLITILFVLPTTSRFVRKVAGTGRDSAYASVLATHRDSAGASRTERGNDGSVDKN